MVRKTLSSHHAGLAAAALLVFTACGKGDPSHPSGSSSTGEGGGGAPATSSSSSSSGGSGAGEVGGSGGAGGAGPITVVPEDFEGIDVSTIPQGSAPGGCAGGFDVASGDLALTLGGDVKVVLLGMVSGVLTANGVPCAASDGTPASAAATHSVHVTGTAADEVFILDLATGPLGAPLLAGGVHVDLGEGHDTFALRGSYGVDHITAGSLDGGSAFDLDGSGKPDVFVAGAEALLVSLGPGNDFFRGAGVDGSPPLALAITVYGGAGDDLLEGGAGDDTLHGGPGDDTFTTAATADGADTYDGGEGHDTVDYSLRTAALAVSLDGKANDGAPGEKDDVTLTIEGIIGGAGDDVLLGGPGDDTIRGGPGNDVIKGGPGDDSLYGDAGDDVLEGGPGDDMLDGGPGHNSLNGGEGDGDICIDDQQGIILACELY
jgi:Ca2+-binding RTX toxin-like protein